MQISRTSWHYKLVDSRRHPPRNLCPYMRSLFWAIACLLTKGVGITLLAIFAGALAVAPIMALVNWYIIEFLPANWLRMEEEYTHLFAFAMMIGFVCYTVIVAVLAILAGCEARDRYKHSDWRRKRLIAKAAAEDAPREQAPPPSVFVEWIKGLHNKTCSSLEFIDDPA